MPLPDAAIERVALYFRALSEPTRLRMINALRKGPRTVGDLTEQFGCSQANISKHLKVLVDAGILARETHGTSTLVSMADPCIDDLCSLVCDNVARDLEQEVALHKVMRKAHSRR